MTPWELAAQIVGWNRAQGGGGGGDQPAAPSADEHRDRTARALARVAKTRKA